MQRGIRNHVDGWISGEQQLFCGIANVHGTVVGALLPISLPGDLKIVWVLIYDCENLLYFNTSHHVRSMEWRLRHVVPAATVTTHAKPHAQQQLARDLEVERAAMGQRCRPQTFGEVQRGNPQLRLWLDFC